MSKYDLPTYRYKRLAKEGGYIPKGWKPVGNAIYISGHWWEVVLERDKSIKSKKRIKTFMGER